jgi:fimbrial isopeptide formation D2 family protein/uncharacterized repeat protein (TIGR01451 family)
MRAKYSIIISIGIIIILTLSAISGTTAFINKETSTIPALTTTFSDKKTAPTAGPESDPYPQLDAVKKVKYESSGWVDEIQVPLETTVRFNISVIYHDISPTDGCKVLKNITIIDHLGELEYKDTVSCSEPTINPTNYFTFNAGTNTCTWKFNNSLYLEENSSIFKSVFYLEFNAKANETGSFRNYVEITGTETCCGRYAYSDADAFVNVSEPDISLTKYVKEGNNWVKSTSVNVGNNVQFKLLIHNTGNVVLTTVYVIDDLPNFLSFNNDANITPETYSTHHIEWNLGTLAVNQTKEITFSAHATAPGVGNNYALVTTFEGPEDNDTVHIIVLPLGNLVCNKTVWNPISQHWVEEINAHIGDTVRFNITITYHGTGTLMNIKVKDILPLCLQYADNANPVQTAISGKNVFWNLTLTLTNGHSTSIEFNTLVISTGTNVNTANITASENCCIPLYCQDTATVIVQEQALICEKKVRNPQTQNWVEEINANIGDTVRFKITFTYRGQLSFYNIWVNDTLPPCLQYADSANPVETLVIGKIVLWHLQIALTHNQSYSIEFNAKVISEGENVNVVNVTGIECGVRFLYCSDTATVIVQGEPLNAEAGGPYTGYVNESIQITGSATGGTPSYSYTWDLDNDGLYDDASGKTISYSNKTQGTKTIYLKVTDSINKNDTDSAIVNVNIRNQPPNTPSTPAGKATVKINKDAAYTTHTTDPNGDQIWYWIDWGDETNSGWVGPFASGATVNKTHNWTKRGTYLIKVKARDSSYAESAYSATFEVNVKILVSQSIQIPTFLQKLIERFPILERFLHHYFSFSF